MDILPTLVHSGESNPVEVDVGDGSYSAVGMYLSFDSGTNRFIVNQPLTKDTTETKKWKGNLVVPVDKPTGFWNYQIWKTYTGGAKEVQVQGTIKVVESFESLDPDNLPAKTPNEVQLENVEKTIANMIKDGAQSYTITGNNTQRITLGQLRKERWYLMNLVNLEREAAGRDYLPGTTARHNTNFMESY